MVKMPNFTVSVTILAHQLEKNDVSGKERFRTALLNRNMVMIGWHCRSDYPVGSKTCERDLSMERRKKKHSYLLHILRKYLCKKCGTGKGSLSEYMVADYKTFREVWRY